MYSPSIWNISQYMVLIMDCWANVGIHIPAPCFANMGYGKSLFFFTSGTLYMDHNLDHFLVLKHFLPLVVPSGNLT